MNVFSSQVAGLLEANDYFTTHLDPLHSHSLFPLCSFLTRQKNMSVKREKKNNKMEMIFWASLQLSRDLFRHLSCLLVSVFRAYAHSWEHSALHLRLLSGALLRQVLMDFSVILKIKITGDVVERRAHYTWAAITFNWVSVMPQVIVCICIFII